MSFDIESITTNGETGNALSIVSGAYARKFSWGDDWNSVRIGVRWCTDRTTTWTPAPSIYLGLSAGTSSLPIVDPSTGHFIGVRLGGTWISRLSPTRLFDINTPNHAKIENGSMSTTGFNAGWPTLAVAGNNSLTSCYIIEFTKGSPWTIYSYFTWYLGSSNLTDITQSEFSDIFNSSDAPPHVTGGSSTGLMFRPNAYTPTINEAANGYLDSMCVAWDGSSHNISLLDFAARKLS